MKVAFVNCVSSRSGLLGVEKKLAAQAKAVEQLGLNMDIFYLGPCCELQDRRIRYVRHRNGWLGARTGTFFRYTHVLECIRGGGYDILLLRYSGADISCLWTLCRHKVKLVTEHHSKELCEVRTYRTTLLEKAAALVLERFVGPWVIKHASGLIGVTDEIAAYELGRVKAPIPSCTTTNGILVEEIPFTRCAPYDGDILRLCFVATAFDPWHGLDRVLHGLKRYAREKPIVDLNVVGRVSAPLASLAESLAEQSNVRVNLLGDLFGLELDNVYRASHVAFSSLALSRKSMREACALKTREYVARGLPFVIGHVDPDLCSEERFFLSVPADESPIEIDRVVAFAEVISKDDGVCEKMRRFALERLDWKTKMDQTWRFLESLTA